MKTRLAAVLCLVTAWAGAQVVNYPGQSSGGGGGATNGIQMLNGSGTNTVLHNVNIVSAAGSYPGDVTGNSVSVTGTLFPKTRYVSQSGNNSTAVAGNPSLAYASISNAVAAASYGDVVHILSGNYTGQVNLAEGVALYYEPGAWHYVPSGQFLFKVGTVTNVVISGLGNFPGSGGTGGSDGRTFFNISNALTEITFEANRIGDGNGSTTDDLLSLGSYKNLKMRAFQSGLLSWGSYNTNQAAIQEWRDAPFEGYYQHLNLTGTNRFYQSDVDFSALDENNFGAVEIYGGRYSDNASPQSFSGGLFTLLGTYVTTDNLYSSFLWAPNYANYPNATNIHGYWFDAVSNHLVAANGLMIQNQNGAAQLTFNSRSGNGTLATGTMRYDGTNNSWVISPSLSGGSGGWTGNPNQFSVAGGTTNIKSGALTTNLTIYGVQTNRNLTGPAIWFASADDGVGGQTEATFRWDGEALRWSFDNDLRASTIVASSGFTGNGAGINNINAANVGASGAVTNGQTSVNLGTATITNATFVNATVTNIYTLLTNKLLSTDANGKIVGVWNAPTNSASSNNIIRWTSSTTTEFATTPASGGGGAWTQDQDGGAKALTNVTVVSGTAAKTGTTSGFHFGSDGKVGLGKDNDGYGAGSLQTAGGIVADLFIESGGSIQAQGASYIGWGSRARMYSGGGSPEGSQTAPQGSLYLRIDGGAGTTLYVKESGSGNTGWVAK